GLRADGCRYAQVRRSHKHSAGCLARARLSASIGYEMVFRTGRKSPPPKGKVRVKILPKDPLVARQAGLWPVEIDLACASPGSGPTGPQAVVVDYNADLDARFAPARLLASRVFGGIARLPNASLLDSFTFHQVNVWAIVERTLSMIEDKYLLARSVP